MTALSRRIVLGGSGSLALAGLVNGSAAAAEGAPLRLVANENPYGPSESAKQAMMAAMSDGWMYDIEDVGVLTRLIADREGLKPENVIITEGSGELLKIAGLAYGSGGAEVVSAKPTFTQLQDYAERNGGHVVYVELDKDMRHDLGAMEGRITNRTGLVYVCNPNNPTGTVMASPDKLRSFIGTVSGRAMLLIDEAYIDLCDEPAKQSMVDQVRAGKNAIIARTFSKVHGMAGLRVGYGLARPDIIQRLSELRTSSPNRMGLKAAVANGADAEGIAQTQHMIAQVSRAGRTVVGVIFNRAAADFDEFAGEHGIDGAPAGLRIDLGPVADDGGRGEGGGGGGDQHGPGEGGDRQFGPEAHGEIPCVAGRNCLAPREHPCR